MIRQIFDDGELFRGNGYYSAKAAAYFKAYGGGYDFCRFYAFEDVSGNIHGGAMAFNSGLTVFGNADMGELAGFIELCAPDTAECPPEISDDLDLTGYSRVRRTMFEIPESTAIDCEEFARELASPVPLMKMSEIMGECFGGLDTGLWYTDISHRVRHGVSLAYLYKYSAAAAVDFTDGERAYISSVAVSPSARENGYARRLLGYIGTELRKNNVKGVLWADESSESYYRHLSFPPVDHDIIYVKVK